MKLFFFSLLFSFIVDFSSQTIENITFSSAASNDDSFQPVMGTPYGASLSGTGGSLEVSASYGESNFEDSSLSADELSIQRNIRVFPNPSKHSLNIDLNHLAMGEYNLYLVDLNGKYIYNEKTEQKNIQIDMSNYSAGSYWLKVKSKETKQLLDTYQIIKTK
tara:strand:+ start:1487 stop:1972 length:486 start_codon:yes stop_codon:yes gene_type:complete